MNQNSMRNNNNVTRSSECLHDNVRLSLLFNLNQKIKFRYYYNVLFLSILLAAFSSLLMTCCIEQHQQNQDEFSKYSNDMIRIIGSKQQQQYHNIKYWSHISSKQELYGNGIRQKNQHHHHHHRRSRHLMSESIHISDINNVQSTLPFPKTKTLTTNNSQTNHINNDNDDELIAIIHIGPMKTGSSSIQRTFYHLHNELYNQDHYEDISLSFSSSKSTKVWNFIACFRHDNNNNNNNIPESNRKLLDIICHNTSIIDMKDIAIQRQNHVIISAEYLTSPLTNIKALQQFLLPLWKKHRIIAYYRRYYDWLVSLHNQIFKYKLPNHRISIIDFISREVINTTTKTTSTATKWDRDYIVSAIERYSQYFNDIKVYNLHEIIHQKNANGSNSGSGDIREHFYCTALINATHSCNQYRQLTANTSNLPSWFHNDNPSMPLVYSEIIYYAIQMKLIPSVIQMYNNTDYIIDESNIFELVYNTNYISSLQHYHENILNRSIYDFGNAQYMICPNTVILDLLLQKSLYTEELLFPIYYNQQGRNEILNDYQTNFISKKLCNINVPSILHNEIIYRNFLQTL